MSQAEPRFRMFGLVRLHIIELMLEPISVELKRTMFKLGSTKLGQAQ